LKLPIVVETNPSDFAIGAILSQVEDGHLKPVIYNSREMDKVGINYKIYNKEVVAIISLFKESCYDLQGAPYIITVFSDYKNLEYFATTKVLNKC
jgi:hypothetical protein